MEMKWFCITVIVLFGGMFVGLGFSEHFNNECRIEAMKAGYTKEAIKEICR